ncbi:MAG TPA: thiol peroxidase [Spirochaetes bacterium]|nr:thiol peroxidase [Spirochaetota bacterium]
MEKNGVVTFKGGPVTLVGPDIKPGDTAPNFTVLGNAMNPVSLSDYRGQVVILSVVPSLDTPVCELQTRHFNQEAVKLNAKVLTISMDLPFAQKRFCDSFKIENVLTLSDFRDREFGRNWGLIIKELGLLARAVYVIDREGKVAYREIVKEIGEQPDYAAALEAARKLSP